MRAARILIAFCFLLATPSYAANAAVVAGPVDVRHYGAKLDGVTDDGPAINACFADVSACAIPPSAAGAFVNTAVVVPPGDRLSGYTFSGQNVSPKASFPGMSFILCSATVTPCVTFGDGRSLASNYANNLIVSRAGAQPASPGVLGVLWNGGYNDVAENVFVFNHGTCMEWDAPSTGGISFKGNNIFVGLCSSHYLVFNAWPEANIVNARIGMNGTGNPGTAGEYVLYENTMNSGAGAGPNGISFTNTNFINDTPGCAFRWANFTYNPQTTLFSFTDDHVEGIAGGGSVFCTDGSLPALNGLMVSHM